MNFERLGMRGVFGMVLGAAAFGGALTYTAMLPKLDTLEELYRTNAVLKTKADAVVEANRRWREELDLKIDIRNRQVKGKAMELYNRKMSEQTAYLQEKRKDPIYESPLVLLDLMSSLPKPEEIMKSCLVEAEAYFPPTEISEGGRSQR